MVVFPNCKINLGLQILDKRPDGYHNLQSVFYPIPLWDVLEIVPANEFSFTQSGLTINGLGTDNICVKAYQILSAKFKKIQPVHIHLHKVIPMGAGLGGGSADGAFTLMALNSIYDLALQEHELTELALLLGSDCPFFIRNKPCFATGRGEVMEPVTLDLRNYKIVLVNPGLHISTGQAFKDLKANRSHTVKLLDAIQQPVENWKGIITNDFEDGAILQYPELRDLKAELYNKGALYAAMSGSGSTFFGIYELSQIPAFDLPANYKIFTF